MGGLHELLVQVRDLVAGSCPCSTTLESTQVQIDGFFSQLPYKCHQNRVASVGD